MSTWTGQNCFTCSAGIYEGQEFWSWVIAGNVVYFHEACEPRPLPPAAPLCAEDEAARARARAKAPRLLTEAQALDLRRSSIRFYVGPEPEGRVGAHAFLKEWALWFHVSAKESPHVRFLDGDALPVADSQYVARFSIGKGYLVRVCSHRQTGLTYFALPTDPEALEVIEWWDVEQANE